MRRLKKLIIMGLCISCVLPKTLFAETIVLDGELRSVGTIIKDERKLISIRDLAEVLGFKVTYDSKEKAIVAYGYIGNSQKQLNMWIGNKNATYGGNVVYTDVPPVIIEEKTYVPLRFVAENFGFGVDAGKQFLDIKTGTKIVDDMANQMQHDIAVMTKLHDEYISIKDYFIDSTDINLSESEGWGKLEENINNIKGVKQKFLNYIPYSGEDSVYAYKNTGVILCDIMLKYCYKEELHTEQFFSDLATIKTLEDKIYNSTWAELEIYRENHPVLQKE